METDSCLRCSRCGVWKEPDEFHRNKAAKSGRKNYCKVCLAAYRKRRRAAVNQLLDPAEADRLARTLIRMGWVPPPTENI